MQKIILITGVSSGVGNAFVKYCLNKLPYGWTVVGLGRNDIDFNTEKLKYLFIKTDLSNESQIHATINNVVKKYGRIDVFINNAGVGYQGTIEDLGIAEIRQQFEINFFGPVILLKSIVAIMRKQNYGEIINISSVGSTNPNPTLGYYDATKSAFDVVLETLTQEIKTTNINVCTLILGAVRSGFGRNMVKFNKETDPYSNLYVEWEKRFAYFFKKRNKTEEAANAIYKLISNPKRVSYLRFSDLLLCKAKQLLPAKIFDYLNLNIFFKNES